MATACSCRALAGLLLVILLNVAITLGEEYIESSQRMRKRRESQPRPVTTLRVTAILEKPYLMLVEGQTDQYEGFIKDLLDAISDNTGFEYVLTLVPDGKYGGRDTTGIWNGMIGELVSNRSDIAGAPLTMTSQRKGAVHFLHPYQHLGLTIVAKKPSAGDNSPMDQMVSSFRIMAAIDVGVWAICMLAFFVVAGLLWVMNRFNPYEWRGRYNLGHATAEEAETFNVSGALWYTFTTLQWQGFERAPRSVGGRLLSVFWFAFVTITLVTYTGSIVNNLFWASTVHSHAAADTLPFRDLEELLMLPNYKVGVIAGGSSYAYLTQVARGPEFDYLRGYFNGEGAENLVRRTADGLQRCREDKYYALVMESTTARFSINQHPCDLTLIKEPFSTKAYGMPFRKDLDQDIADLLHIATLQLLETGVMEALEDRWFNHGACWNVTKLQKVMSFSSLQLNRPRTVDLSMFWGPLVMLLCGILIAILTSLGEGIYFKMRGQYDPKNRPGGRKLPLEEET